MSFDLSSQDRSTLPDEFVAWADKQGEERGWGRLNYIAWHGSEPEIAFLDYGDHALEVRFRR